MPRVIRKPPSKQTRAERLINLKAARAARKSKGRRKQKKPRRIKQKVKRKVRRKSMAKRRRVDILTGGTKDVNPQLMTTEATLTTADATESWPIITPIARVGPASSNRATVLEVFKVYANFGPVPPAAAAQQRMVQSVNLSTIDHGTTSVGMGTPDVFANFERSTHGAFTAAGTYMAKSGGNLTMTFDLTDGAGHGFLIANDTIYMQIISELYTPAKATAAIKMLYRFKSIPLVEYIGIIGSTSGH